MNTFIQWRFDNTVCTSWNPCCSHFMAMKCIVYWLLSNWMWCVLKLIRAWKLIGLSFGIHSFQFLPYNEIMMNFPCESYPNDPDSSSISIWTVKHCKGKVECFWGDRELHGSNMNINYLSISIWWHFSTLYRIRHALFTFSRIFERMECVFFTATASECFSLNLSNYKIYQKYKRKSNNATREKRTSERASETERERERERQWGGKRESAWIK